MLLESSPGRLASMTRPVAHIRPCMMPKIRQPMATGIQAAKKAAPAGAGTLDGGGTAMDIIEGLGGKANIVTVENCITRLRVSLKDPSLLQEALINKTVNRGIVKKGNDIQIIYGLQVADVRRAVEEQLEKL